MLTETLSPNTKKAIDFSNTENAFALKTDAELKLAYWLFKMVSNPALVKVGGALTLWAVKLGLPIDGLIKKTLYRHFCGGEDLKQAEKVIENLAHQQVNTVLDYAAEAQHTEAGFEEVKNQILNNIRQARKNKDTTYISLKMTGLGDTEIFRKLHNCEELSAEEIAAYDRTRARLEQICLEARACGVTVFIDAEESWLQDPIDRLAERMMLHHNQHRAVVFNTLQMYRTDRLSYLRNVLKKYENSGIILGIKLVRGAYLEKEQLRAKEMGYPCPVFTCKADTDQSFDAAAALCLEHLHHAELCAATHNELSTKKLAEKMQTQLKEADREKVSFSQLLGMSDNLTFNLAKAGFRTSKYLPYGTVKTALPYLIRRAEENTSISGQMGRELGLLQAEMQRRKLA